jgi:hypothetical protein
VADKRATIEAVLAKQQAAAQEQASMLLDDAKQRSEASDKALTEKRTRIERELAEEQANAKIRAAKIIEDAEQRLAEANERVRRATDIEREVSEQVNATFGMLEDARQHFMRQAKLPVGDIKSPVVATPKPAQDVKAPTNGQ